MSIFGTESTVEMPHQNPSLEKTRPPHPSPTLTPASTGSEIEREIAGIVETLTETGCQSTQTQTATSPTLPNIITTTINNNSITITPISDQALHQVATTVCQKATRTIRARILSTSPNTTTINTHPRSTRGKAMIQGDGDVQKDMGPIGFMVSPFRFSFSKLVNIPNAWASD